jgi:hypothetical protein
MWIFILALWKSWIVLIWLCDLITYLLIYIHFFGTVGVDCGFKFYSFIRFAYVQDQATYSLYLFLYNIVKFCSTTIPFFQQNYRDLFLMDWLLFKINSAVSQCRWVNSICDRKTNDLRPQSWNCNTVIS